MRRFSRIGFTLVVAALVAGPAFAQPTPDPGLPPLLDRELFFGDPEISNAQLSPDGKYVSFIKPWQGTRNIWVKEIGDPFEAAKLITADPKRPIPGYSWTRDSRYVLFVQDHEGDENFNVYAVDPKDKPAVAEAAPAARNLTGTEGVRAIIYSLPKTRPDTIYVGLNDRDAAWHDLYEFTISTGERKLMRENTEKVAAWIFDLTGELRIAVRTADNGDTEILRVDGDAFTKIYSCSVFETCSPDRFHTDGNHVYIQTNRGDDVDLIGLALLDPESGALELVESDPEGRVDLAYAAFSSATDELVATAYMDDRMRVYYRDEAIEADMKWLEQQLEGREVGIASATADDQLWLVAAEGDTDPGERYLFDRKAKQLTLQYKMRERIPREHMATMQALRYLSSDGLEIPAYLTLPKGVAPKDLPLVVLPHGGPWARDSWGFRGMVQFLANRGYAVLQPNFRSSTGYGKAFLNAGNNQWGDRMQDDLTWGVKHLVAKGIVDPKRVAIMGGSYGGYATLAGAAFTPKLYAAAVSIVGPSNLITLLESIPPYWEAGRVMFHERMGNPETAEGRKQLERQSPLNSADKIVTPLLVVQGANDPRVKQAESDQIVVALRDRGFPVAYIVAPDEGHGFRRPVNNLALFAAAERFLGQHLGVRAQEDATPDVTTRLKEITVDPKTVVLAEAIDADAVGLPEPATDLSPGTASYVGTIEMGGQSMPISIAHTIAEDGEAWVVTDTVTIPMGEILDTCTLEKGSLILAKRTVKQGPVEIEVASLNGRASGTMSVNGQEKPIDLELGGALFADGAATRESLAALPLAEGYTTRYRNLDIQKQKVALKQLEVVGREEVAVPAGAFDTWKVRVTSAEGDPGETTLWIATDTRQVVKTVASVPEMNGAIISLELQP
jgi:dipeptidyl aminopeptidase/acylaminoacyl peptidase